MVERIRGYAEGYYGKLLTWSDRCDLLDALARNRQNTYYYAPKEDSLHRLNWRAPYDASWLANFTRFTDTASAKKIEVVAGVAPGLDFNFQHLPHGPDFISLLDKCRCLLNAGASHISLLLDDIDENFATRCATFKSEGAAHASLANALSNELGQQLWVTPRIYANELVESAPDYLPDFLKELDGEHTVLYCGSDVVASIASVESILEAVSVCHQRLILWDNLYANDYCPRRLFVGPWTGRHADQHILLNPTGMPKTDALLLALMASSGEGGEAETNEWSAWKKVLLEHEVPTAFISIAEYFYHPVCNGISPLEPKVSATTALESIEECLWRWKTPLSREWYPYIFGLKHDLLVSRGELPELRVNKTQNYPLAQVLTRSTIK